MRRLVWIALMMAALLSGCTAGTSTDISVESASSLNNEATVESEKIGDADIIRESREDGSFKSNELTDDSVLYLYSNTQASIDVKRFHIDGTEIEKEIYQINPEKRPAKQDPIICSKNKQLYLLCSDGITICSDNGSRYMTVVPGDYTAFTIVGDKIYYANGTDGNLYACDLDGNQQEVMMNDPDFAYNRESTLQDVSFLVDQDIIYYVAAEPDTGRPNTVKAFDMVSRATTTIATLDDNVQMLWSTQEQVYFQNLINLGQMYQYKELYSVEKSTNAAKKILDFKTAVLVDNIVYYTQPEENGIFSWKNGSVLEAQNAGGQICAADQHKLYFSDVSNEPLHFFDVDTRETGIMQDDDFHGRSLFQSLDAKSIGNHFY